MGVTCSSQVHGLTDTNIMSDISSIASAGTALSNAQLGNEVATRVAVKAQNVAKQQGQAMLSLLEGAMEIQQQSNASVSSGGKLDVTG